MSQGRADSLALADRSGKRGKARKLLKESDDAEEIDESYDSEGDLHDAP